MYDLIEDTLSNLKKYSVNDVVLSPDRWKSFCCDVPLVWASVKFKKSEKIHLPADKGVVYSFIIKPSIADHPSCSYLMYIGKAQDQSLRDRFQQYFYEKTKKKGRPKIQRLLNLWDGYLWFCYATIDDTNRIHEIEGKLIGALIPPCNDEYPSDIRNAMKAW